MQRMTYAIERPTLIVAIDQPTQRRETSDGRRLSIVNKTLQAWWTSVLGTSGRERIGVADGCHGDERKVWVGYRAREKIAWVGAGSSTYTYARSCTSSSVSHEPAQL